WAWRLGRLAAATWRTAIIMPIVCRNARSASRCFANAMQNGVEILRHAKARCAGLRQQGGDGLAVVGDRHGPVAVVEALGVIDAYRGVDRREKVRHGDRIANNLLGQFVGLAVSAAMLQPAAGQ